MPVEPGIATNTINELLLETKIKIFEHIKYEHEAKFPADSLVKDDPTIVSLNVYNMTMNYCIALMQLVIADCLELQRKGIGKNETET